MAIPRVNTTKKGPQGLAEIKLDAGNVYVTFESNPTETIAFPLDEKSVKFDTSRIRAGRAHASVSADKKTLYNLRPAVGTFQVKVVGMAHPEDQLPTPKLYEGMGKNPDGTTYPYSYEAFTMLLEIVSGGWTGTIITANLRYLFVDSGNGESAGIRRSSRKSEHTSKLVMFMELAGIDFNTDTIPYSDNVLPWLEKTLVSRGKVFSAIVNNGWVESFGPPIE